MPHISALIGSLKLSRLLSRLLQLALPLTLLTLTSAELIAALDVPVAPGLSRVLYRLSTLAAWELSFLPAILAKGHPSLLGLPSIVKSCSRGDSDIEGRTLLLGGLPGLSADGPDHIFTPSFAASALGGDALRNACAASTAACTFSAAPDTRVCCWCRRISAIDCVSAGSVPC